MDKIQENPSQLPCEENELLLIFQNIFENIIAKDEELKNEEN